MTAPSPASALLAALYHESCRPGVAAGTTLAHAVGQARPFTEFADLSADAMRGRINTASELLGRYSIAHTVDRMERASDHEVEQLAQAIHECEKTAVDRGWTVVKLDPPRPWITFADLPEPAQAGRRKQAKYLLDRLVLSKREPFTAEGRVKWDDRPNAPAPVAPVLTGDELTDVRNMLLTAYADEMVGPPGRQVHRNTFSTLQMAGHAVGGAESLRAIDAAFIKGAGVKGFKYTDTLTDFLLLAGAGLRLLGFQLSANMGMKQLPTFFEGIKRQLDAAKDLGSYIFEHHATTDESGAYKVDPEAVAPQGDEDAPAAALRLLRLAHERGAFDPAGRDQLRTANELAEQAVITTSCLWHLLAELTRLDPENTALDEDPIRFREAVMEIAARRFDYIAEPGPEDGDTTDTFAGHVRDSRELSEVRRVLEAAIGRDPDPARSTLQVARDFVALSPPEAMGIADETEVENADLKTQIHSANAHVNHLAGVVKDAKSEAVELHSVLRQIYETLLGHEATSPSDGRTWAAAALDEVRKHMGLTAVADSAPKEPPAALDDEIS